MSFYNYIFGTHNGQISNRSNIVDQIVLHTQRLNDTLIDSPVSHNTFHSLTYHVQKLNQIHNAHGLHKMPLELVAGYSLRSVNGLLIVEKNN